MRSVQRKPGAAAAAAAAARRPAVARAPINRALERQAEEATNLALRGQVNASRVLTPAPAAGFRQPASLAEPLPAGVRREAEVAFGADLAAVRVHRDAAAWAAARAHGTAALAAGNHIYFGERQWEPHTSGGKRLLYHELAHVLQQTGRRESQTLIRAQERRGTGGVQPRARGGRRG